MKKQYIAIAMGLILSATAVTGCGKTTAATEISAEAEAHTVYGEVAAISEDSLTIKVAADETAEEFTGEEQEVELTDETKLLKESSGAPDGMGGQEGGMGTLPEMSGSDMTGNSSDGSDSGQNTPPEMSDTDSSDGDSSENGTDSSSDGSQSTPPEKPDGDSSGSGNASSGDSSQSTPPEKSDGDSTGSGNAASGGGSQSTPPQKPDGEGASGESNAPTDSTEDASADTDAAANADDSESAASADSDSADNADGSDNTDSDSRETGEAFDSLESAESSESGDSEDTSDSDTEEADISDFSIGDIVAVSYDEDGDVVEVLILQDDVQMGGNGGMNSGVDSYDALNEYSEDTTVDGETVNSTGTDENAIHVTDGANVTIKNSTITRDSDDSTGGDNSSFYGVGAAVLTTDGTTYISDTVIDTDAKGAAGVFAYGDGTVYVADSTITTTQDTSGGIHAAGGGTLYAWDLTVETNGESSAAIRSDRGGGTMVVDGGSYTSNGTGSPAIYSTADITVSDASLTATGSEAICIEGLNSIRLYDCDLTGNMSDSEQNDCTWNVILYQSMSGDSEVGNSTFEMSGGTLTAENGGMFYTTNTESTITLSDVDITYADDSEFFLRCTGNNNQRGWGTTGSNGADCLFTAISQEMTGDVIWDSISQLDFYMTDGSTLTGAVTDDETYAGEGGDGYCNFYIESGSTWVVTGDSTLTNLYNEGTIVDADGNTVTIKGTDGTIYVEGTSAYTITVDSYQTSVDVSGASSLSSWSDYEVTKPEELA